MNSKFRPIRTTVVGGFVFLIPVVFVFVIGAKAIEIMRHIATPIVRVMDLETTVFGIGVANLATVIVVVVFCYLAGLVARSALGTRIYAFIDEKLISIIPQYAFVKSMTPSGSEAEFEEVLTPAIVRLDDSAVIAFIADEAETGLVTVFVPGAPNPWSGSIMHVESSRVQELDMPISQVVKRLRFIGRGMSELLSEGGVSSSELVKHLKT